VYPIKILLKGLSIWHRDFAKFSVLSFFMLFLVALLSAYLSKIDGVTWFIFIIPLFFFVPLVLSMFSTASSYSFCDVKHMHIDRVVQILRNAEITINEQLNPIKDNIKAFENRVKVRIISLRMFMVLCWTWVFYMWSELNKYMIETKTLIKPDDMLPLTLTIIAAAFLYVAIESYSKANILIFRSALIGCNEYEFIINSVTGHEENLIQDKQLAEENKQPL